MTTAQMNAELLYQASLSPFKIMLAKSLISPMNAFTVK